MEVVNLNAAGIDVGSKSHFVAVGQAHEDVKKFGVKIKTYGGAGERPGQSCPGSRSRSIHQITLSRYNR